jgi:hypothetical protein
MNLPTMEHCYYYYYCSTTTAPRPRHPLGPFASFGARTVSQSVYDLQSQPVMNPVSAQLVTWSGCLSLGLSRALYDSGRTAER